MTRLSLVVLSVLVAATVSVSEPVKEPKPLPPDGGRLTITEHAVPGSSSCTAEYVRGDTLVRAKVTHSYNLPTRQSSISGDLLPVYLVVTGTAPPKLAPIRSAAELFKALTAGGYTATADGGKSVGGNGSPRVGVYTVVPTPKQGPAVTPTPRAPK